MYLFLIPVFLFISVFFYLIPNHSCWYMSLFFSESRWGDDKQLCIQSAYLFSLAFGQAPRRIIESLSFLSLPLQLIPRCCKQAERNSKINGRIKLIKLGGENVRSGNSILNINSVLAFWVFWFHWPFDYNETLKDVHFMVSEWLMKLIIEVHLHKVKPIVYYSKKYSGIVFDFDNKISLTLHWHFEALVSACITWLLWPPCL